MAEYPGPNNNNVLYFDINPKDYSESTLFFTLQQYLFQQTCPGCRVSARWFFHGTYQKYHGNELITIHRARCRHCKSTHAIMPAFSLPYSSLDVEAVDGYFLNLANGNTRRKAAQVCGLGHRSYDFLRRLDKRLAVACRQAKAANYREELQLFWDYKWLTAYTATAVSPIAHANRQYLERYGKAFFCGNPGSIRHKNIVGLVYQHKKANVHTPSTILDSS